MLVVTFGRAASQELRERVRAQLVEAERALADAAAGRTPPTCIELLLALPTRPSARCATAGSPRRWPPSTPRRSRPPTSSASMVLGSLGVAGDTDAGATLVEDLDDLLVEVVDDLYLRAFASPTPSPLQPRRGARDRAGGGRRPAGAVEPADEDPDDAAGRRVAFAGRAERDRAPQAALGILSYDDLLTQLAEALEREDAPARARMRHRWQIVLVDEFQDTDPVQWQVLDRAFSGHATMVLIGDPEAGDLRLPRRDVAPTSRPRGPPRPPDPRRQLAQRRRPARVAATVLERRRARRRPHRRARRRRPPPAAGSRAPRTPAPFRLRVVRRDQLGARGGHLQIDRPTAHRRDLARDIRAPAGRRSDVRRAPVSSRRRRRHRLPARDLSAAAKRCTRSGSLL